MKNGITQSLSPTNKVLLSFVILIFSGALLLMVPGASINNISFIDALFTSTSAVCVTGLVVLDTARDFSFFGQIIILLLIQFGGLGIMTFSIAIFTLISGSMSIKWRFTFESFYSDMRKLPIKHLLFKIVTYTFIIEFICALILFTRFYGKAPLLQAIWHSVFHSVSAFCNAGFSTFSENLVGHQTDWVVLMTIGIEIVLGGLGFLVLHELSSLRWKKSFKAFYSQFTLHTKMVLFFTIILIFIGMSTFMLLEWGHSLSGLSLVDRFSNSFFQSVTCRTAGFNTVDIGALRESTLFMMIFLMFTGGSPGSIAGGIKVTTMGVIWLLLIMKFRGKSQIVLWDRALDEDTIDKSTTLFILALIFVSTSTFFFMVVESLQVKNVFLSAIFEVTSAFGTVGLSMGITPALTGLGKFILCLVMYTGRLGPLTLISALTSAKKDIDIQFPDEHIMIG